MDDVTGYMYATLCALTIIINNHPVLPHKVNHFIIWS